MSTLLIELSGPMQSWGSRSRFATRATELAPTKSGVVGLVAAALGLARTDSLEQFTGVRFGVRIDQPGRVERDFQTEISLDGSKAMPLSHRYYLSDAVFLAGLESGDTALLGGWQRALAHPAFPLYLGRRAFPPAGPAHVELVSGTVEEALAAASWRATPRHRKNTRSEHPSLPTLIDARPDDQAAETQRDEPISFDPRRREYGWRSIISGQVAVTNPNWTPPDDDPVAPVTSESAAGPAQASSASHDPMTLLAEGS